MTHTDETEETKPEGTRTVFTILGFAPVEIEPDGTVLLEAHATDGTVIWLGRSPEELYQVLVEGPEEPPGGRYYRGGPGSLAHDRFTKFRAAYERDFGPLDAPQAPVDTDQRQDE